jgi:pimeloyl-[acyl-carrier protein] methyl ester esterase
MKRLLTAAIAAIVTALPFWAMPAFAQERFTATVAGQGPDVILIPGLASSADVWDATVKQLSATHRVHALQVRGFAGEAAGPNAEGPILQPLIDEIAAYAATLDRPALIGHSIGGLISMEVAAKTPDEIGRVMVVDALPFYALLFNPAATAELAAPYAEMNRKQILGMTDAQFAAGQTQTMNMMTLTASARPTLIDWSLTSDRRVVAETMAEVMLDDARPRLAQIKAPVTVVYAWDQSMGQPVETANDLYGNAYAGLPSANLVRIDGSYHFIMLDQPEAFAREVAAFLK